MEALVLNAASKNNPFFLCWGLWTIPLQENRQSIWKLPMTTRGTSWPLNLGNPILTTEQTTHILSSQFTVIWVRAHR